MAFELFRRHQVEVAVLEVGLGGRLDSTNVVTPVAAAITSIDLDHQALLGSTIAEIAYEKAGIIKPDIPVVLGETKPEAVDVITRVCGEGGRVSSMPRPALTSARHCSKTAGPCWS